MSSIATMFGITPPDNKEKQPEPILKENVTLDSTPVQDNAPPPSETPTSGPRSPSKTSSPHRNQLKEENMDDDFPVIGEDEDLPDIDLGEV